MMEPLQEFATAIKQLTSSASPALHEDEVHRDERKAFIDGIRDLFMLKLRCNKCSSAYTQNDPSIIKQDVPFQNTYMSRREHKSWSWILRRLKPGMTVLAKPSSNLTNQPTKRLQRNTHG
jgi:hypothetical protein